MVWSSAVVFLSIATIIWTIALIIAVIQIRKLEFLRVSAFILFSLGCSLISNLLRTLAIINANAELGISSNLFLIISTLFVNLFLDLIYDEKISLKTAIICTFFITISLNGLFLPDAITFQMMPDGTQIMVESITFGFPLLIFVFYLYFRFIFLVIRLLRKTPHPLRKYSIIFAVDLIGTVILLNGLNIYMPEYLTNSGVNWLITAVSNSVIIICFVTEPKLASAFLFTLYRLAIVDSHGGLSLYSHIFNKREEFSDDILFSGMIQGVNLIINETVNKGELLELKMANGIMILERSEKYPVVCILIVDKSSAILRSALKSFFERFVRDFSQYFADVNVGPYKEVEKLIELYFPFVPIFD